ncbi:hypothetical protein SCUCBS95973_005299 [Sporothrix curviconia]|uniref:Uncharacterized protein n=1 Tax=Sporothrix curviconia TaxID=1260050 RepID=A0ABP0BWL3_9PEZI
MAWDSKAALASRRRTNSSASCTAALTLQQKPGVVAPVERKSAHVADPFLQDFLQPGFDPAAYWNATLSGGSIGSIGSNSGSAAGAGRTKSPVPSSTSTSGAAGRLAAAASSATATADRAAQAQATLSQLGAHTSRLTTVLTQLTDDIIRSGRRLAYEVQLLRGETLGLGEVLEKHLALLEESEASVAAAAAASDGTHATIATKARAVGEDGTEAAKDGEADAAAAGSSSSPPSSEPPSLAQLRMLAQVRSRLDALIKIFGEAMEFTMPPSAISVTSSFLSVSGPDQESRSGSGSSSQRDATSTTSLEEKGQKVLRSLRDEVARLLDGASTENDSVEAAAIRVEALRTLCRVWVGTAEEKARTRFVESLQRMVEDRQRELDRERERLERQQREKLEREAKDSSAAGGPSATAAPADGSSSSSTAAVSRGYAAAGYGFISQLQKIRSGL